MKSEIIEKGAHSFEVQTFKPTCTEQGYTRQYCKKCNYENLYDYIPSIGHDIEPTTTIMPTCTQKGEVQDICMNCGESFGKRELPLLDHNYIISITKEPTIYEEGIKTFTCSVCGYSYTETIDKITPDECLLKITYVMSDGTPAPTAYTETVTFNSDYSVTSPTVTGYTPDIATVTGTMGAEDVTVTVTYTPNSHTVTWNVDGEKTVAEYVYGDEIVLPSDPQKTGYGFYGWSEDGETVTEVEKTVPDRDIEYKALWQTNRHTITLYYGEVNADAVYRTIIQDFGTAIEEIPEPKYDGFVFTGWNSEIPATMPDQDLEFYALWKKSIGLEDLTYSIHNSRSKENGFDYPDDYIIQRESYYYIFGKNVLSKTLVANSERLRDYQGIVWGGNCFGMSTTTGLFNSDSDVSVPDFNNSAKHVSELKINDVNEKLGRITLTRYIESMQVSQYYNFIQGDYRNNKNKIEELCGLIENARTTGEYPVIALFGPEGGHAVVGYDVEKISETETWIHIYDCNYPNTPRHIVLYTNPDGEYTGWKYNISANFNDWASGKPGCSISYVPYEHFKLIWEYRGNAKELLNKMKSEGVDGNGDILALNSTSFEIRDFDGNTVCKAENGQFVSYDQEAFEVKVCEISTGNGYMLMLPADYYTIENKDESIESFELTMANTDLGATVSTTANTVSIAVDDEYDVNNVSVDADKGEKYEMNLLSSMDNGYETITLSGVSDGKNVELSCIQGQVDYSVNNSTGVTLTIDGEEKISEQKDAKITINKPSTQTINYGDTLVLHAKVTDMPKGARVVWTGGGETVQLEPSKDGLTCKATSVASGEVTITAKIVDASGKAITNKNGAAVKAEQKLTSKAGFIQKLISFFKNLFRVNRVIAQSVIDE